MYTNMSVVIIHILSSPDYICLCGGDK